MYIKWGTATNVIRDTFSPQEPFPFQEITDCGQYYGSYGADADIGVQNGRRDFDVFRDISTATTESAISNDIVFML